MMDNSAKHFVYESFHDYYSILIFLELLSSVIIEIVATWVVICKAIIIINKHSRLLEALPKCCSNVAKYNILNSSVII